MRRVMVRYRLKPERLEEHEALINEVFVELSAKAPEGIHYGAFKHGLDFVHIAFVSAEGNPLTALTAFKAFTAKVAERTEEPPVTVELAAVGTYGF